MIRTTVLLCWMLTLSLALQAQHVLLTSQSDVNGFNPALEQIESLTITKNALTGNDHIQDLSPLANLKLISGNLTISELIQLQSLDGLNNLEEVGGKVVIKTNIDLHDIKALNNVHHIGDDVLLAGFTNIDLNGTFNSVETIGGNVKIGSNNINDTLSSFNSLIHIDGDLEILINTVSVISGFNKLQTVNGSLILNDETMTHIRGFDRLESIGNELIISGNSLISINAFANLIDIGNNFILYFVQKLKRVNGFSSVENILGDCLFTSCDSLLSVEGFESLSSIGGDLRFSYNPQLNQIGGFDHVTHIGGSLSLDENDNLHNVDAFHSLIKIDRNLNINLCNKLSDIDFFQSLRHIRLLNITNNAELQTLKGLTGVDYINIGVVTNNPNLNMCCGILYPLLFPPDDPLNDWEIHSNAPGCNSEEEITVNACNLFIGYGKIQYDSNSNDCATGAADVTTVPMEIIHAQLPRRVHYSPDETYSILLQQGTQIIRPFVNPVHWQVSPNNVSITIPADSLLLENNFCLTPISSIRDLEIDLYPIGSAVPGFIAQYIIAYENKGTVPVSGTIELNFPDEVDFHSSIPNASNWNDNQVSWSYSDIQPLERRTIRVILNMHEPNGNPPLFGGEELIFNATIYPVQDDETPNNNGTKIKQTVVNSFDPNDKTCFLGESLDVSETGAYATYRIRFENLGTANARRVEIIDTLDSRVYHINTLKPVDASHPYTVTMTENIAYFTFSDINLPFEDDENDGYVIFKIKTKETLEVNDTIKNFADIYFDYNFPVRTNVATTIITKNSATNHTTKHSTQLAITPTIAYEEINFTSPENCISCGIYNSIGQRVESKKIEQNITASKINVSRLPQGKYILRCRTTFGHNYHGSFLKL